MQTRVKRARARRNLWLGGECREVVFSVAEARRALVYVAGIARDAAEAFGIAQSSRMALQCELAKPAQQSLSASRDSALRRLNHAIDDCNAVGADLVDISQ